MSRFALRKGLFAGSGSAAFNEWPICHAVLNLTGRFNFDTKTITQPITVLYLGTASYDLQGPRVNQTQKFAEAGCEVLDVAVALQTPAASMLSDYFSRAHVVIVSGGNTLYAMRRWTQLGIDKLLADAAARGVVMSGGSAGAICWFDGGHSDSMDPDTYVKAMVQPPTTSDTTESKKDEASEAPAGESEKKPWTYIRVSGLGFLPGLLCPHYDRVQSNGILRAVDFDGMLRRHPLEKGISIDHWAALIIDGDVFRTMAVPGKEGSGLATEGVQFVSDGSGVPTVWVHEKEEEDTNNNADSWKRTAVPLEGELAWLVRPALGAIVMDPLEEQCAMENPIPAN